MHQDGKSSRRTRLERHSLNLRARGLKTSATLAINERSRELEAQGKSIVKLGLGQSPFPVPRPVVRALQANAHQKDYLPTRGLPALREAVAQYHHRNDGVVLDPTNVLVGPGSKELMFLAQLAYYGDLVIPSPCWVSYAPQAQIIGREVRYLHTDFKHRWRVQPEQLQALCEEDPDRPRILILNYPGNPDGSTYGTNRLEALARIARRYGVILLSDEIYGKLHFQGTHVSVARYYPEGTIISSGLSKWCGAGGWRLGTFSFPSSLSWLLDSMAAIASETYTSTSAPIQYAAITAFNEGPDIEDYLFHSRRVLSAIGKWACHRLRQAGARLVEPQGGFYMFPDFSPLRQQLEARGITTSRELAVAALEQTGVAFLPGADFGRAPEELTARLAFVDFDGRAALEGSREVPADKELEMDFLTTCCGNVVDGVERLACWLQGGDDSI